MATGTVGTAPLTPVWGQYFEGKERDAIIRRLRMTDGPALVQSAVRELTVARQNAVNRNDTGAALIYETRIRQLAQYGAQVRGENTGTDITTVVRAAEREADVANALAPLAMLPKLLIFGGVAYLLLVTLGPAIAGAASRGMARHV